MHVAENKIILTFKFSRISLVYRIFRFRNTPPAMFWFLTKVCQPTNCWHHQCREGEADGVHIGWQWRTKDDLASRTPPPCTSLANDLERIISRTVPLSAIAPLPTYTNTFRSPFLPIPALVVPTASRLANLCKKPKLVTRCIAKPKNVVKLMCNYYFLVKKLGHLMDYELLLRIKNNIQVSQ